MRLKLSVCALLLLFIPQPANAAESCELLEMGCINEGTFAQFHCFMGLYGDFDYCEEEGVRATHACLNRQGCAYCADWDTGNIYVCPRGVSNGEIILPIRKPRP